jgi:hypothetical protein
MTVVTTPKTDTSQNNGLLNCRITVQRIFELLDLEEEDEYGILKPTAYAIKTAIKLVIYAYDIMEDSFPKASVCPDEKGGIMLDWSKNHPDCAIHLFCPRSPEIQAYISHQKGDEYAGDYEVSSPRLSYWLHWFNNAI